MGTYENLARFGQNFPLLKPSNRITGSTNLYFSDWLPGACILHRRSNLHLLAYYPFSGKAYAEDLYHSYILTLNNVRLVYCSSINVFTEAHPVVSTLKDSWTNSIIYYRISRDFCRLTKTPKFYSIFILLPYIKASAARLLNSFR